MNLVVGSVLAPFKMEPTGHGDKWLTGWPLSGPNAATVTYFAALEVDTRGLEPYEPLLPYLATYWTYQLDDHRDAWQTGGMRHRRVCMGRNLIIDYAMERGADAILFLDADVSVPTDALERLLELDYPNVALHVPTYALSGPVVPCYPPEWDVQRHWTTAGCILWRREVYQHVRWHWNGFAGQSDDPATQDVCARLGYPTLVRHDRPATHHPESIGPLELRGHDLTIRR